MKNILLFIILILTCFEQVHAQVFGFYRTDSITVIDNSLASNDTLVYAWSGGLSQSQISSIDVDLDGNLDLFVFDRVGHRTLIFKNEGLANMVKYKNHFADNDHFPGMNDWVLLEDYNGDGKNDIFHYWNGGVSVYKNTSTVGNVSFNLVKAQIKSNYIPNTLVLYVSPADLPGIVDVDLDGDLDILTFGFSSGCMEYHKNLSQETYGHNDSLVFIKESDNWGLFNEGISLFDVQLGDSCDTGRHAGSNILAIDMDGDTDKDLVLGDAGGSNLAYLRNGGNTNFAVMDLVDPQFPQNYNSTIPVNLTLFASAFYLDVNNDNKKDLLVSNSATGNSETANSIWYYKNDGTTPIPDFKFQRNDFLQSEMIELGEGAYPALFDFNRDGLTDLAIGNVSYFAANGQVAVLRNIGTISQPVYELVNFDMGNVSAQGIKNVTPTFGDMDDDGDVDMIVGETTGYIHYYENTAPVMPNSPAQFNLTTTQYFNIKENSFSAPFIIDLNQDGKNDIVCGSRLGKLNYYENIGTAASPNFNSLPTISNLGNVNTVDPNFSSSGYSVPWFFMDNGKLELFVGSYSGKVLHYTDIYDITNNIQPIFTFVTGVVGYFKDGYRSAVAVEKLNADTYPDMIYGNLCGGVDLLYGKFAAVGIEETTNSYNPFKIYPNPAADDFIYIQTPSEIVAPLELTMHDVSGRCVIHLREFNSHSPIEIGSLNRGIYFIILRSGNSLVSKLKFIKQ